MKDEWLRELDAAYETVIGPDMSLCGGPGTYGHDLDVLVNAYPRLRRIAETLEEIANAGCGLYGSPEGETCLSEHPDDRGEWCWSCVARHALGDTNGEQR